MNTFLFVAVRDNTGVHLIAHHRASEEGVSLAGYKLFKNIMINSWNHHDRLLYNKTELMVPLFTDYNI